MYDHLEEGAMTCSKCEQRLKKEDENERWFRDQYGFPLLCLDCYMGYLEYDHGARPS